MSAESMSVWFVDYTLDTGENADSVLRALAKVSKHVLLVLTMLAMSPYMLPI